MAADRHPRVQARRVRAAGPSRARRRGTAALDPLWQVLSTHYATGIAQVKAEATRGRPRQGRRGGLRGPGSSGQGTSRAGPTVPADRGRDAARRTSSRPCTRRSGPAGRCSMCPRESRSRPRCSAWSGCPAMAASTWTTRWSCSRKVPRRRWSARPRALRADTPALHVGAVEISPARGAAPVRQHPELGHEHLALQPRARAWSGRTPPCNGPSAPSARGWPRSTRRSR